MRKTYGRKSGDYHYRLIPPTIIINKLLLEDGDVPADYNIYCYHGSKGFDCAIGVSLPGSSKLHYTDGNWNEWESVFTPEQKQKYVNPANWPEMLAVARELSRDFDFVRVDLYNVR